MVEPAFQFETFVILKFSKKAFDAISEIQRIGRYKDIYETMEHILGTELCLHQYYSDGWTILVKRGNVCIEIGLGENSKWIEEKS